MAVNRSGEVRVWSSIRGVVVAQVSLLDLLLSAGALPSTMMPTSATAGRKPTDKGVQLQGERGHRQTSIRASSKHTYIHSHTNTHHVLADMFFADASLFPPCPIFSPLLFIFVLCIRYSILHA